MKIYFFNVLTILVFLSLASFNTAVKMTETGVPNLALPLNVANLPYLKKTPAVASNIIFKTTDGGQTWNDISPGLPAEIMVTNMVVNDRQLFLSTNKGLFHSSSAFIPHIWEEDHSIGKDIWTVFPGKEGLYIGTYYNGIVQEVPGSGIWATRFNNLNARVVNAMLETTNGNIFIVCDDGLFKSSNEGASWKKVFNYNLNHHIIGNGEVLLTSGQEGILRSTDSGENWNWVKTDFGQVYKMEFVKGGIVGICEGTVPLTGYSIFGGTNRLIFSADKGQTWQQLDSANDFGEIYDITQAGKYLFCSHKNGISRSSDQGKTWELVRPPQNDRNRIILEPSGDTVFAVMFYGC